MKIRLIILLVIQAVLQPFQFHDHLPILHESHLKHLSILTSLSTVIIYYYDLLVRLDGNGNAGSMVRIHRIRGMFLPVVPS
jgi:hypothetical protein